MALKFYTDKHLDWIYTFDGNYYSAIRHGAIYNTTRLDSPIEMTPLEAINKANKDYNPKSRTYILNVIYQMMKEDFYKEVLDEN
jgi:hypothetical protein